MPRPYNNEVVMKDYWKRRSRKSPRLPGYDYSREGAYFVTICTHQQIPHFGKIVDGQMEFSEMGKVAVSCWAEIPAHFPQVELDVYVIMPNHVHGIVLIVDKSANLRVTNAGTRHASSVQQQNQSQNQKRPKGVKSGSLGAIVGSYKSAVTRLIRHSIDQDRQAIWQERYHDRIIHDERSMNEIRNYVLYNPAKWENDRFYAG
jgi:putative transposase